MRMDDEKKSVRLESANTILNTLTTFLKELRLRWYICGACKVVILMLVATKTFSRKVGNGLWLMHHTKGTANIDESRSIMWRSFTTLGHIKQKSFFFNIRKVLSTRSEWL